MPGHAHQAYTHNKPIKFQEMDYLNMASKLPILLYHDLESSEFLNEKSNQATLDTVVDAKRFEAQIRYLYENGYKTISMDEYFSLRKARKAISDKSLIISFDDGHYSNYYIAYPVLRKYGYTAIFFVVASKVDSEFHMTREQLVEMAEFGMEIGSHGLTHEYLPLLDVDEIKFELFESKKKLEAMIKRRVQYFAFPGGHYNTKVLGILNKIGYTGSCSCKLGVNGINTSPHLLRRIEIRKKVSMRDFEKTLEPCNIILYGAVDFFKSIFRKVLGLERYADIRSKFYKYYIFKK